LARATAINTLHWLRPCACTAAATIVTTNRSWYFNCDLRAEHDCFKINTRSDF
jgi:hypothetical protein